MPSRALDLEELEARAERTYRARTAAELAPVLRDLPGGRRALAQERQLLSLFHRDAGRNQRPPGAHPRALQRRRRLPALMRSGYGESQRQQLGDLAVRTTPTLPWGCSPTLSVARRGSRLGSWTSRRVSTATSWTRARASRSRPPSARSPASCPRRTTCDPSHGCERRVAIRTPCAQAASHKGPLLQRTVLKRPLLRSGLAGPSDGLEPSTPSLPCAAGGNWSQPTATVSAYLSRLDAVRLPPIANGCDRWAP
jgi:Domain of unknown function (DUF1707)